MPVSSEERRKRTVSSWMKIGTQWVIIIGALIMFMVRYEHRVTAVEAGLQQELKGYASIFKSVNARLDRMEDRDIRLEEKLDRMLERQIGN